MELLENKKLPLSVIIITKNEEERLPHCLKSVNFAEDIVVVDAGSQDRTIEIAKSFGCRVFIEKWKGYGPQKQSALEKTYYKWVLSLDADERIPPETAQIISQVIQAPKAQAYSFLRKNFFHGKWIKYCGWWPDRVIRLFEKGHGKFEGMVHETWVTEGKIIELKAPIEHYSYENYSQMLKKLDEYSSTRARELYDKGIRVNLLTPFLHGGWMFIRSYFLKLGFLNGLDGFVISFMNAGSSFFKYAKLLELQKYARSTKRL
ncbi:MAG: glycosyltransferase family 2 protein [Candidatus Desulfofervidus sp.]|nr:glycosyltransferase family 2 protein [Candidatus Desulfofervidus sp.]